MTAAGRSLPELLERFPILASRLPGLERAAGSEAPVLLVGEPGTGRSTLARALHAASRRAEGPLVEVDPGAVPASLFESELFGHRPGAFTGAGRAKAGWVERSEGGTLLLDHVEALPLEVQPKLLRLLAERRYAPLGGQECRANVRFLTLADESLPARIDSGAFRTDLYYRLEVLAFRVPPLRERRDDLPVLTGDLVADLARRMGRSGVRVSERALGWISSHPWPGNLTQLKNFLERELILLDGDLLDPAPPAASPDEETPRPLAEIEAEHIRRTLAYTRGHQGEAARLLGISRKGLWEKRKRHRIP